MKLKSLFVLAVILFVFSFMGMAQDKYEFAIVRTGAYGGIDVITKQGTQFFKLVKGQDKDVELLKKLNELTGDGWEVFSPSTEQSTAGSTNYTYHLKRKEK